MRRKSPRVVWLPQSNINSIGDVDTIAYQETLVAVSGATGSSTTVELPMVLDAQQSAIGTTDSSLADIEGSAYRLRRIVGKIWVQVGQTPGFTPSVRTPVEVICTAGFIVRIADTNTGQSLAANVGPDEIDPALIDNSGDPWIWRRSWVLGNRFAFDNAFALVAGASQALFEVNPQSTNNWAGYGSGIQDGPHVDQKTARIVGPEHRLFLDFTATISQPSLDIPGEEPLTVGVRTDIRCLGSLRTSVGNRRNASR